MLQAVLPICVVFPLTGRIYKRSSMLLPSEFETEPLPLNLFPESPVAKYRGNYNYGWLSCSLAFKCGAMTKGKQTHPFAGADGMSVFD